MAYKEVSRVEIIEVIRQWQAGRGIREITRSTGVSRNTMRKYILTAQSYGLGCTGPPPTDLQARLLGHNCLLCYLRCSQVACLIITIGRFSPLSSLSFSSGTPLNTSYS